MKPGEGPADEIGGVSGVQVPSGKQKLAAGKTQAFVDSFPDLRSRQSPTGRHLQAGLARGHSPPHREKNGFGFPILGIRLQTIDKHCPWQNGRSD